MTKKKFQVVGDPVAHSLSPDIHQQFAAQFGDDLTYGRERVPLAHFTQCADAFRDSGGMGMNVTVPLKGAAYAYVDELEADASVAGAVNTILFRPDRGSKGFNTDGSGLVADLTHRWQVELTGRSVLILGAGGASRGVIVPLAAAGVREVTVANRTVSRARELCADLAGHLTGDVELRACGLEADLSAQGIEVVINATSTGLSDEVLQLPLSNESLAACFCYDMGYGRNAGFLNQVRDVAGRCADGLGMLVEQAADSYAIWLGHRPDTQPVYEKLRAQIGAHP